MSVLHSPNNSVGGGSQPDLSKISGMETDSMITLRKRKFKPEECSCAGEMKGMRSEITRMTDILEKYTTSNELMINKMQENITHITTQLIEVKSQINEIKSSTHEMEKEQNTIKTKVNTLEIGLNSLQATYEHALLVGNMSVSEQSKTDSQDNFNEKMYREVQERGEREKNVILMGIPEQQSTNAQERTSKDMLDVLNITATIDKDIAKPIKVIRIGKFNPEKVRKVKVCYETNIPAKFLLRNKSKLPEHIKVYSDQTPAQYKYLQKIKAELARRQASGESNLTIKYIQGTPCITEIPPKN